MYILFAIIIFGMLIAVHEFGHFIVAKACGVKVNEFSIGMGPLLFSRERGETLYSLRLLPIGGFCAMEGEDEDSDDERAFSRAAGWKKFLILIAGALFNLITGIVISLIIYSSAVTYVEPVIADFMDGCPMDSQEYLMVGDEIHSVNGRRVLLTDDLGIIMMLEGDAPIDMKVRRDGQLITLHDVPMVLREYEVEGETVLRYGLYFTARPAGLAEKLKLGFYTAVNFARNVFWSLEMLFEGMAGFDDLSGPVGIVKTMSDVGEASPNIGAALLNLFHFGAFLSVNLCVMNLLPIPALDGGRIFLLLVNGITMLLFKRRIPERLEAMVHIVGMVLLMILMAAVMLNDVLKIFT